MTYGYIRVSTAHQNLENQQLEIQKFAENNGIKIDRWIEEKISGTKNPESRKLGKVLMHLLRFITLHFLLKKHRNRLKILGYSAKAMLL